MLRRTRMLTPPPVDALADLVTPSLAARSNARRPLRKITPSPKGPPSKRVHSRSSLPHARDTSGCTPFGSLLATENERPE